MSAKSSPTSVWTPALITAIASGIVAVLGAVVAMIVTLHGIRQDAKEAATKSDKNQTAIVQKADEIHTLVNKNYSDITAKLEVANTKIDGLEGTVRTNAADKKVADDLAARAPMASAAAMPAPAPSSAPASFTGRAPTPAPAPAKKP
jgi:hypothetical protein